MRKYKEIEADFTFPTNVIKIYVYYAYKDGKSFGPFDTKEEAEKVSKNVERVCDNQEVFNEYYATQRSVESNVYDTWERELRQEYSHLNQKTYDLIYSQAYDRGHSSGYDEVANYMIDYAQLATDIIDANK